MRVLEHGVNIEVEKPLCIDLAQADEVLAKAKAKNARVAVHHQRRTSPSMQAVAKVFAEGKIGDLRYIYASGKGYYAGYGLMNIGTHVVNNMLRFGGKCRSVMTQATTGGRDIIHDDVLPSPAGMGTVASEYATATLQFDEMLLAPSFNTDSQRLIPMPTSWNSTALKGDSSGQK